MKNKSFTPFPVLTTARLTLRQLSTSDGAHIFALRSDPEINKYLDRQASKNLEDAINFINRINDNIQKNKSIYWAITLTNTKTFAGTICLFDFLNEGNKCEIGFELLTDFQGKGIMQEAAEKVIAYAFNTMRLQKIEAFTHRSNRNSAKLLEKLNFIKEIDAEKENAILNIFTLKNSQNTISNS